MSDQTEQFQESVAAFNRKLADLSDRLSGQDVAASELQSLRRRCKEMGEEAHAAAEWIQSAIRTLDEHRNSGDPEASMVGFTSRQSQELRAALIRANSLAGGLTVAAGEEVAD